MVDSLRIALISKHVTVISNTLSHYNRRMPESRSSFNQKSMSDFATTADIKANSDEPLWQYVCRYTMWFAFILIVAVVANVLDFRGIGSDLAFGLSAFFAYVGTQRRHAPRFRSLGRFWITMLVAVSIATLAWPIASLNLDLRLSPLNAICHSILFTLVAGSIDLVRYLAVCVVTPGR